MSRFPIKTFIFSYFPASGILVGKVWEKFADFVTLQQTVTIKYNILCILSLVSRRDPPRQVVQGPAGAVLRLIPHDGHYIIRISRGAGRQSACPLFVSHAFDIASARSLWPRAPFFTPRARLAAVPPEWVPPAAPPPPAPCASGRCRWGRSPQTGRNSPGPAAWDCGGGRWP